MLDLISNLLAMGVGAVMVLTAAYAIVYGWEAFCKWARIR